MNSRVIKCGELSKASSINGHQRLTQGGSDFELFRLAKDVSIEGFPCPL
jgi:hypothetical protein